MPLPRINQFPTVINDTNSALKYEWKLLRSITYRNVLYVTEATTINNRQYNAVVLILTSDALIIVSLDEDVIKRVLSLDQLEIVQDSDDPTLLSLNLLKEVKVKQQVVVETDDNVIMEMDPACRARVADYVRSTASLLQLQSEMNISDMGSQNLALAVEENNSELLSFYVNPQSRNYFICLLLLAKQNSDSYNFPVL